jgi:Fic family protein
VKRIKKQELFNKADELKELINRNRPDSEQIKNFDHYLRVAFTYSSNALAGSSLTLTETRLLLEEGITEGGKPMKDYHEASGHAQAYDYMLSLAKAEELTITEDIIKRIHYLFYQRLNPEEAGQYRKSRITIAGSRHLPPKPEEVAHLMEHFINQMQSSKPFMHPIEFAAICHKRLLDIQPFQDGNDRIARLFMNLILVREGYGVTMISPELGNEYTKAIMLSQQMDHLDIDTLIEFIAERVIEAQRAYSREISL